MNRLLFASLSLVLLAGCSLFGDPEEQSAARLQGQWEAVSGDLQLHDHVPKIYARDWFIFDPGTGEGATVSWSDGLGCPRTEATLRDGTLHFTVGQVSASVEPAGKGRATIRFHDAETDETYSKTLERKSRDTEVLCY